MHIHRFPGLGYTPLLSYLAALGLAKTVAEQSDPGLLFGWRNGTFVLETTLDDVAGFLVETYRPTPILSPWSGGSGFGEKDKTPREFINLLKQSRGPRLALFRESIATVESTLALPEAAAWANDKERLVQELRNRLPDEALGWLDASVVLTAKGPAYPPILGTGGNDGRLDFSTNFHQRLADVLPELGAKPDQSRAWATDLLQRTSTKPLVTAAVGQTDPAGTGGPGSSIFGGAGSLVNPWEYVLMLEGATLFAASAAKRFSGQKGRGAMPFTVASSPDGPIPGAEGEEARGELWAPVVESVTLPHFRQILNEARYSWGGTAADSVPAMYGAVCTYGVDRGIALFQRYGFLQRNGLAFIAAPLDAVRVEHRPEAAAAQRPLRRADAFGRAGGEAAASAYRRFQAAATAFLRSPSAEAAVRMLKAQTLLELAATRSGPNREKLSRPGPLASLDEVLSLLSPVLEASPEARVAAGIASGSTSLAERTESTRTLLLGADPGSLGGTADGTTVAAGLGHRPVVDVLADLMVWLAHHPGDDPRVARGWLPWRFHRYQTPWQDVHAWVGGQLSDAAVGDYLLAFLALDWHQRDGDRVLRPQPPEHLRGHADPALAALHALASGRFQVPGASGDATARGLETSWAVKLRANQVAPVHRAAAGLLGRSRYQSRDESFVLRPRVGPEAASVPGHGPRLLAALAAPSSADALLCISPTTDLVPSIVEEGDFS